MARHGVGHLDPLGAGEGRGPLVRDEAPVGVPQRRDPALLGIVQQEEPIAAVAEEDGGPPPSRVPQDHGAVRRCEVVGQALHQIHRLPLIMRVHGDELAALDAVAVLRQTRPQPALVAQVLEGGPAAGKDIGDRVEGGLGLLRHCRYVDLPALVRQGAPIETRVVAPRALVHDAPGISPVQTGPIGGDASGVRRDLVGGGVEESVLTGELELRGSHGRVLP